MKVMITMLFALSFMAIGCAHKHHHHGKGHHHHGHHKHFKKHWEKMDADKDGTVTKAEFDQFHAEKFKKMDANNDGKVTKEERKAFFKSKMNKDCGCDSKEDCKCGAAAKTESCGCGDAKAEASKKSN